MAIYNVQEHQVLHSQQTNETELATKTKMAETAVSLAGQHALPKILEAVKMLRDLPKEVRDITDELESFQDFINDADKVAEAEQDDGRRHRIKERVMRLREAAFRMEDVIDEYNISCEDKQPDDPRCAALLCEAVAFIKTQILLLQSAYKIQDVKSLVRAERDGFQTHFPLEPRLTSSRGNQDVTWQKLRMDPLFIEENDVVGLDGPRDTLKNWLTKGREKRTVISVVGIPGKAFQYSSDGDCPEELKDMSLEIVRKCKGLPLAIVVIGGLLSQKDESAPEWKQFSENLCLDQLERNSKLNSITKILGLSYDDLPINLRSCLLYFGMYPEDYEVKSDRLIRQWIAEGFVKHETGKTLEEVAHQYLSGLVRRSLVQVSSFNIDGKVKRCRVHDLIHDMILRKVKDTGFCLYIDGPDQSVSSKIVRRLTVATDDFSGSIGSSPIRSILIMTGKDEKLSQDLVNKFPTNYMLLKDIGGMTSLQEIPPVIIDDDGVERADESEVIDLYITSPMSTLRKLVLWGTLTRLTNWISQFPNLVQLSLVGSKLTNDAFNSLKNMPRLLFLDLSYNAYEGETLHFQCGGFQKLKQLYLGNLDKLKFILIDRGALCSLEVFSLQELSQLKTVPSGIQHLEKLKDLYINYMPTELVQRIAPDGGEDHWIIQDVPHVRIWSRGAEEPSHIFGRSHH
ncbi:Disease resistance RPP8-like protein 3 [Glycine soja]|uniref:Disease resistance RPP8-like protein 3 n=1 Tax=Glycine soja TaxID=3848 RepID=A0A0B2SHS7_GLYSO|nr:Disease resistance RPP8-like protein 3 [Glycine soja]